MGLGLGLGLGLGIGLGLGNLAPVAALPGLLAGARHVRVDEVVGVVRVDGGLGRAARIGVGVLLGLGWARVGVRAGLGVWGACMQEREVFFQTALVGPVMVARKTVPCCPLPRHMATTLFLSGAPFPSASATEMNLLRSSTGTLMTVQLRPPLTGQ